ncbi:RNA polymerase sigma factor [Conexibacter sp. CPCC 206217]|uniref:RNA polymerase sigma factor n=1 Tax=Conexibacter sp. CPCC 206217 TaxID=3064574 RepID=UPI0027212051|nr:RNA polymerase sigma factor [Conexibacter sp. CPCC 206217]MDO8209765.1 RNA polymerase sigma factor [Conexibacter sp. CPCC 206217]
MLRLQSDERLIALVRRGNHGAFEVLVSRYQARLLAFCRHMLGSKEDAEDVLQEVFAASFNAILADDRPINARPWLYRIARNRSLNHLRRQQPIGVDSMDVHLAEHGTTTADKVHKREEFRELIADVGDLPETQRTALLLREIDALSYEQIAEAMETTIPSVKSLLVRARVSLAEAAEARQLSCDDVRLELGEIAEGLKRRTSPPVRRHIRTCASCAGFRQQLKSTNKALAAVMPVGFVLAFRKVILAHLGLSASASGGASATGAAGAAAGSVAAGSATGGLISAGMSTLATKAAAGLAAAALVTAGAVEIEHRAPREAAAPPAPLVAQAPADVRAQPTYRDAPAQVQRALDAPVRAPVQKQQATLKAAAASRDAAAATATAAARVPVEPPVTTTPANPAPAADPVTDGTTVATTTTPATPGQTQVESGTTALPSELPADQPPQTVASSTPPPATTAATPPAPPAATTPVDTPPPATTLPAEPAPDPVTPPTQTVPTTPVDPPPAEQTPPADDQSPPPTTTPTDGATNGDAGSTAP